MRIRIALVVIIALIVPLAANAQRVHGAIFTTVFDGSEVNYNIYPDKFAVYLDGGPGPGAPQSAAGLPDGVYVFMVTDPSGRTLLSSDAASCRLFTITAGIITTNGLCTHATGADVDHGAKTIGLMPYDDTPNPGGEYKVWVTNVENYACAGSLNVVDCTLGGHGYKHGFKGSYSKTDNFKVRGGPLEIDTRFFRDDNNNGYKDYDEAWIDGLGITWYDTQGASNQKWSYENLALDINHEAHVEDVEVGTHYIDIADQPGCSVGTIWVDGSALRKPGPQTVSVNIKQLMRVSTVFIDVLCKP